MKKADLEVAMHADNRRRLSPIAWMATVVGLIVGMCIYLICGHARVEKVPHLLGKPLEAVIARLGKPDQELEYQMKDSPGGEFRVELYNTYPPGAPNSAEARIKELQWDRSGYRVAVWMHLVNGEWSVLNTCRWKDGIEF